MNTVLFFKALGDDTRQEILRQLKDATEISVSDLCRQFPTLRQPTISHHLQVLRQSGLVVTRKVGRHVLYQLNRVTLHAAGTALHMEWRIEEW